MPMSPWIRRSVQFLSYLPPVFAAGFILLYLAIVLCRIGYPFELQWMEGATVDHVLRILDGKPLYIRPSLEFVPFIYPPLYYLVAADMSYLTGPGFLPLRLVSLLASLGSMLILYLFVVRETRRRSAGFFAAGVFAATYFLCEGWYDIGRVDSLLIVLLLGAAYLLRFGQSRAHAILAGVLIALAFFTKQIALVVLAPVLIGSFRLRRPYPLLALISAVIPIVACTLYLHVVTSGWSDYYLFRLPAQHAIVWGKLISFWTNDLLLLIPALVISIWVLFAGSQSYDHPPTADAGQSPSPRAIQQWQRLLALGFIGGALLGRLHSGGYVNVVMPAYAALALLCGIGYAKAISFHVVEVRSSQPRQPETSSSGQPFSRTRFPQGVRPSLLGIVLLQCLLPCGIFLRHTPSSLIPTENDRRTSEDLISMIARTPGPVYMPFHGYLPRLAGKSTCAHAMAIYDILRGTDTRMQGIVNAQIGTALAQGRFSMVITDRPWYSSSMDQFYERLNRGLKGQAISLPVTGLKIKPEFFYAHRSSGP